MKLPDNKLAYIPKEKLTEYLLAETHPIGRFKAKFFKKFGFHINNAQLLEQALLAIAQSEEVVEIEESAYGTKYTIDGKIDTPSGFKVKLQTVWIIEKG